MPSLAVVVIVAVVALFGFLLFLQKRNADKRKLAMAGAARMLGLQVATELPPALRHDVATSDIEKTSDSVTIRNVLLGDGNPAAVFDLLTSHGSGETASALEQTVVAIRVASVMPHFHLRRKGAFGKVASKLGFGVDVDCPEFKDRFYLSSKDKVTAQALFTPAFAQTLCSLWGETGCVVEGAGRHVLVYRPAKMIRAEELPQFLAEIQPIVAAFDARARGASA